MLRVVAEQAHAVVEEWREKADAEQAELLNNYEANIRLYGDICVTEKNILSQDEVDKRLKSFLAE
jgi:hypothetical protein